MGCRLLGLGLIFVAATALAEAPETVPGEFIVKWRPHRQRPLTRVSARRVEHTRAVSRDTWAYRLEEGTERATREAMKELAANADVELVQPNYIRRPFLTPNDTHYPLQWGLKAARLEGAWDRTTGSSSVVVAVIDTGIVDHPDLEGRIIKGYDFITADDSSGDGDGKKRDSDPTDTGTDALASSGFHGTHVAGIIGAAANNQKGIAGVNWGSRILAVRALGINAGKGTDADISAAIRWAGGLEVPDIPPNKTPARVINLSFGGPGESPVLTSAVMEVQRAGVIVVAAAGNQAQDAKDIYPAAIQGVITVGATKYDGARASYSNHGSAVDLVAPGGSLGENLPYQHEGKTYPAGILSTLYQVESKTWGYHFYEGTSQASPLVAGVVSLMLSLKSDLTSQQVLQILQTTADQGSKCELGCGAGLIDAAAALARVSTLLPNNKTFGASCVDDLQCAEGICRSIAGLSICTSHCSRSSDCPDGGKCTTGLCLPSQASGLSGQSCTGEACAPEGSTVTGGCTISPSPTPMAGEGIWLAAAALLAALFWRRGSR